MAGAGNPWDLLPTPQYAQRLETGLDLSGPRPVHIVRARASAAKTVLAARLLKEGLEKGAPGLAGRVAMAETLDAGAASIRLVEWPCEDAEDVPLSALDREALSRHHGQGYVLRTLDEKTVAVVGAPLGLLYGVMTLLQLLEAAEGDCTIPGAHIRDFPSFQYRAAAGWLLNGEANRWSFDRGRGLDAYEALCRRKLDQCLSCKINMVVFDGFGFGLSERLPEYPALMRRLNAYSRQRGIHLVFGGYGAGYGMAYQPGPLYEEAPYLGTVWRNRASYPDGPVYTCMGYPRTREGLDPGVFGTCRSNQELNRLKAEELAAFVGAVEPGALYIHHEDYGGMDTTQRYWLQRCDRCRQRWPSDDAAAAEGAAGAVGHGYAALVEAVNAVRNAGSGYAAARDCLIILTSPVYVTSSPSPEDWSNALRFWQNVARALPPARNLMACFREIFPRRPNSARWVDAFNAAMAETGRPLGAWVYFIGGGDHWVNDYPFVATAAMNALFLGARGIYNASGNAYEQPQQLLNAEYSWNVRSDGFFLEPTTHDAARGTWLGLVHNDTRPREIFEPGGWLERICRRLYGRAAAPMARHFSDYEPVRPSAPAGEAAASATFDTVAGDTASADSRYLPMAYEKVYGVPVHWRRLALDSKTWSDEIGNEIYAQRLAECGISRAELHARLRRQWEVVGRMSERSAALVREALAVGPAASCREDLEFLQQSLRVTLPLSRALIEFHEARRLHHAETPEPALSMECLRRARRHADEAAALAASFFPTVSDPSAAEVGSLRARLAELRAAVERDIGRGDNRGDVG